MTVNANANSRWEYIGDGTEDTYVYDSRIFASSDLVVYVGGSIQIGGYTVTGVGEEDGGTVIFDDPPADTIPVTITRDVPDEQPAEFNLGGKLLVTSIMQEFDRRTIVSQQRGAQISRILRYNVADQNIPSGMLPLIEDLKGKALTFSAVDGSPEATSFADLSSLATSVGDGLKLLSQALSINREGFSLRLGSSGISTQIPVTVATANRTLTNTSPEIGQDRGRLFVCSGTWTFTLPELVEPWPEWFHFYVHNAGSGTITLARSGSVDGIKKRFTGLSTWAVRPGETITVVGDRENLLWRVINGLTLDDDNDTHIISVDDDIIQIVCGGSLVGVIDSSGLTITGDISATGSVTGGGQVTSFTGEVRSYIGATPPTGWLMLNGDSIGSAASGADQASDDYETLYSLFWDSMADTQAPVAGGRGASAAADFAANKALTMPDARGRAIIGSGQGSGLTNRVNGVAVGAERASSGTSYGAGGQCCVSTGAFNLMQPSLALNYIVRV